MAALSSNVKCDPLFDRAYKMSKASKSALSVEYCMCFIYEWKKITEELKKYDRKRAEKNHA